MPTTEKATASATPANAEVKAAPAKAAAKPITKRATPARKTASATQLPTAEKSSKAVAIPAPTTQPVPGKVGKVKKPKMVRDSFTIPKPEYDVLDVLKLRAAKLGAPAKKTELVRAGIKLLAALSDSAYRQALAAVPSLKTGRPAKAPKA